MLLAALLAVAAAACLCCSQALAVPADRAAALSLYDSVGSDLAVPSGWTGSTQTCTVGTESAESLAATLHTANVLRDFVGVAPVSFDDGLNHKALAAALMMTAQGDLSHDPPPDWKCYSEEGKDGASHSNLSLGASGASAMLTYADDGDVPSLGHRRWLLDPSKSVFGSGSTGSANALYVLGGPAVAVAPNTVVPWPAAGWFPRGWIPGTWSVNVGGSGQAAEYQSPSVSVSVDGQPVAVSDVQDLGSFGTGRTLSWRPALDTLPNEDGDHDVAVTVSGAVVDGQPFPLAYTVKSFRGAPAPPPPPPPPPGGGGGGAADDLAFLARPTLRRKGSRLIVGARVTGGKVSGYRWLRDGHRVKGARGKRYRLRRRDRGHRFSCRVTAKSPAGATLSRTTRKVRVARR